MRLRTVVCYISIPIYQLTPCSCPSNALKNHTVGLKLIDRMSDKHGRYSILTDAITLIRSDITYGPRLSNCWLPASTWVEALTKLNLIDVSLAIDVRKFNSAMSKSPLFGEVMPQFNGSNTTGVFRITFQKTFFYYFADKTRQVWYPFPSIVHGRRRLWKQPQM